MSLLLDVRDLCVSFGRPPQSSDAVRNLSFQLQQGETLALVGESGSGKSVTALSIMRLIEREGGRITQGQILLHHKGREDDVMSLNERMLQAYRGAMVSMVFQEPMTSLNPVLTVGKQLTEVIQWHRSVNSTVARRLAVTMLDRVQLSNPEQRLKQYPHELSGGMRQRVMIAMALVCRPSLLIADEPTTALDVTIQAEILSLLQELKQETNAAILFITHDIGVVSKIADTVVVMRNGERVETATTEDLFKRPQAAYTKQLINSAPQLGAGAPVMTNAKPDLLEVCDLVTRYSLGGGYFGQSNNHFTAVDGVSFSVKQGETVGLVGESGSGKSTIGRSVLRLVNTASGSIKFNGTELTTLSQRHIKPLREHMQMVFQDPFASLNPRIKVLDAITEPLVIHKNLSRRDRQEIAAGLVKRVGLDEDCLVRYPHQFSGGQRQRICIARALSSRPKLIVADEPVSALDVSVQAQVLELMQQLQQEDEIAYLFISHDIAVIEKMSHRVLVLKHGKIVEYGDTNTVLRQPSHDYTKKLLASVPIIRGRSRHIPSKPDENDAENHPAHGRGRYAKSKQENDAMHEAPTVTASIKTNMTF